MASQLESLKRALAEGTARSGADNPFVKGLQAQIALLEKPRADNPTGTGRSLQTALSAGMRQDLPGSAPESQPQGTGTRISLKERMAEMTPQQLGKLFDDLM
jgi:hypothetical protein